MLLDKLAQGCLSSTCLQIDPGILRPSPPGTILIMSKQGLSAKDPDRWATNFLYPSPTAVQLNLDPSLSCDALSSPLPGPCGLGSWCALQIHKGCAFQLVHPSNQGNMVSMNSLWIWSLKAGPGILCLHHHSHTLQLLATYLTILVCCKQDVQSKQVKCFPNRGIFFFLYI